MPVGVGVGRIGVRPLCSLAFCANGRARGDVQSLVEGAVVQALRDGGGEAVRLYVAACAERMAPLFMGLRANVPGREWDLDFYAESVRDLWYADRPLADAAERVRLLERFPELRAALLAEERQLQPSKNDTAPAFANSA